MIGATARRLVLGCVVLSGRGASAGEGCPEQPADWRPQIATSAASTLVEGPALDVDVVLWSVFCDKPVGPSPRAKVRFVLDDGTSGGRELPAGPGHGVTGFRVALPRPGEFTVRVESLDLPTAKPGSIHVRVIDPSSAVPVSFELAPSPLDDKRLGAGTACIIDGHDAKRCAPVVPHGHGFQLRAGRLERGPYTIVWDRGQPPSLQKRAAKVDVFGERVAVQFLGARLHIVSDGLPNDGHMYRMVGPTSAGVAHVPFGEFGASFEDVEPGHVALVVQSVARINPWDPDDPKLRWMDRFRIELEVAAQKELTLRWSTPNALAGRSPEPSPWVQVAGTPGTATRARPRPDTALAFGASEGRSVAIDAAAHAWDGGWTSQALPPLLARDAQLSTPLSMLDKDDWAWAGGDNHVLFHNKVGFFSEALDLYVVDRPYPCEVLGVIAISANDVVAVGSCRANYPLDMKAPIDGFIAVRDANHWQLTRVRDHGLHAVAAVGDLVVAVGDDGQVAWRRGGAWSFHRNGRDDYVGVAMLGDRVVARTVAGKLVDLPRADGKPPAPLSGVGDVSSHCLIDRGVVAFHQKVAKVTLTDANASVVLHDTSQGVPAAIACDRDTAWILVEMGGGMVVEKR
jgi:hypothetical protein